MKPEYRLTEEEMEAERLRWLDSNAEQTLQEWWRDAAAEKAARLAREDAFKEVGMAMQKSMKERKVDFIYLTYADVSTIWFGQLPVSLRQGGKG